MRSRCGQQLGAAYQRTQQTSLLRLAPGPSRRACAKRSQQQRCYATQTVQPSPSDLSKNASARYNEIGVQQLSTYMHPQLFGHEAPVPPDQTLVDLSRDHLRQHELLGKTSDNAPPIGFDLPTLEGATLDEHFHRLGLDSGEPYLSMARKYALASPPPKPRKWARRSGWTKYFRDGSWEAIDAPDAEVLTFDTEVMWRETSFACMACAASDQHWYAWLSPWLLGESGTDRHLIPLGDTEKERIVVGHNIGYDRARIAEEYGMQQTRNFFVDTMSLHVAANGMCSRQRPTWTKARKQRDEEDAIANAEEGGDLETLLEGGPQEEELWVGRSSANSLRDVAHFHCGLVIDKAQREYFGELDRAGVVEKLDEMLDYCAADVEITHKVYKKVFPNFLETCPHPVSFAALRHLSTEILPVNKKWQQYVESAEATYQRLSAEVTVRLADLAEKALDYRDQPDVYQKDPWLSQLDWSGQEVRMVKGKKKGDPPRLAARQKKPGMPNWYKGLFATNDSDMALTVRTRIAPLLLRLAWNGHPLVWTDTYGFTFRVPISERQAYEKRAMTICDMSKEEKNPSLQYEFDFCFVKVPHANGPTARCTNPLAKGYLQFFESGVLGSEYAHAKEAIEMNASCSYWISCRDRIMSQMVVRDAETSPSRSSNPSADPSSGYILPQIIPMGTITRRAVENTWLTASNAKPNRVGSELKSMITAPPGYVFVGADVDSQELWIASLIGDAAFNLHGGNALGFMTLEGSKGLGTDLHSRTASILGIGRGDAKIFNYGRIYGAGLAFAKSLLQRFNPSLGENEAKRIADALYLSTKGKKQKSKFLRDRPFWRGGTESLVFNRLEDFAEQEKPRTPVLGAGITEALMRRFISKKMNFMTSRINWAIQSSGVDYLHLLIVSMDYLCRKYNIHARLSLTVHDEIRYLAKEEDKWRCAMALQVANVWTRSMFAEQMGIRDLPQSCAFFSAVDIDHVLRKEVDMDCVTPSHPTAIPPGTSIDIEQLLAKGNEAALDPEIVPESRAPRPERFDYTPRTPVMQQLQTSSPVDDLTYLKAQIATSQDDWNAVIKSLKPASPTSLKKALKPAPKDPESVPKTPRKPRAKKPAMPKTPATPLQQDAKSVMPFYADEEGVNWNACSSAYTSDSGSSFADYYHRAARVAQPANGTRSEKGWGNTAVDKGLLTGVMRRVVVGGARAAYT